MSEKPKFSLDADTLTGAVESGAADKLLDRLEKALEHPENVENLKAVSISIDKSAPISFFRDSFWNKLPGPAKWAILRFSRGPLPKGQGPIDVLLDAGFILYDHKEDHNSDANLREIKKMGGVEKFLLKYGVKVGKYFVPELRAVEPFIGPYLRIESMKGNLISKIRPAVCEARKLREAPENNIAAISTVEHDQLLSALPSNDTASAKVTKIPSKRLSGKSPMDNAA